MSDCGGTISNNPKCREYSHFSGGSMMIWGASSHGRNEAHNQWQCLITSDTTVFLI